MGQEDERRLLWGADEDFELRGCRKTNTTKGEDKSVESTMSPNLNVFKADKSIIQYESCLSYEESDIFPNKEPREF